MPKWCIRQTLLADTAVLTFWHCRLHVCLNSHIKVLKYGENIMIKSLTMFSWSSSDPNMFILDSQSLFGFPFYHTSTIMLMLIYRVHSRKYVYPKYSSLTIICHHTGQLCIFYRNLIYVLIALKIKVRKTCILSSFFLLFCLENTHLRMHTHTRTYAHREAQQTN